MLIRSKAEESLEESFIFLRFRVIFWTFQAKNIDNGLNFIFGTIYFCGIHGKAIRPMHSGQMAVFKTNTTGLNEIIFDKPPK